MFWPFLVGFRGVGRVWWPLLLQKRSCIWHWVSKYPSISRIFLAEINLWLVTLSAFLKEFANDSCFCHAGDGLVGPNRPSLPAGRWIPHERSWPMAEIFFFFPPDLSHLVHLRPPAVVVADRVSTQSSTELLPSLLPWNTRRLRTTLSNLRLRSPFALNFPVIMWKKTVLPSRVLFCHGKRLRPGLLMPSVGPAAGWHLPVF